MERYRDIQLEMPGAEPHDVLDVGSEDDAGTEDLAAWLRDIGGDGALGELRLGHRRQLAGRGARRRRIGRRCPDWADGQATGRDGPLEAGA